MKLVSDTNEQIGQIEGNKLILDWYAYKTEKTGQTIYEYAHVNAIKDDIYTSQGPTMPEPTKTGE